MTKDSEERSLSEIIEEVKTNKRPAYDELRYAVLALESLRWFTLSALRDLAEYERAHPDKVGFLIHSAGWQLEEDFQRVKRAMRSQPKNWVGKDNDPENPEYQKFHAMAIKLAEKALAGELPNQKKEKP